MSTDDGFQDQMEESEKRRERLKAMRMEASRAGLHTEVGNSVEHHHFSNPLIETSETPPVQMNSYATPRFDYYTDPMAAFSANRRSKVSNQNSQVTPPTGPRNSEMAPSPVHHVQTNYSPDQRMYQAQGSYYGSGPRNPEMASSPVHHQVQTNYSPDWRLYQARGPYYGSGPRNPEMASSPVHHQVQTNYSPDPRLYQARGPYYGSGPRNPEMTRSPVHHQVQTNYSPGPRMFQARGPCHGSGPYGSPIGMVSPFDTHQGTPEVWNGSAGASSDYLPANSSGVGNSSSPGFGGSPSLNSGQGRGHWFSNSPSSGSGFGGSPTSNLGRGRGRWLGNNMRPGLGRGGKRGFGSNDGVSADLRPDMYYDKSMSEDPWKLLKPVIWRKENILAKWLHTPDSLKSSLPKSVGIKKARISEASNESGSQPSLAEYLAAAFNEAVNDETGNDKPNL